MTCGHLHNYTLVTNPFQFMVISSDLLKNREFIIAEHNKGRFSGYISQIHNCAFYKWKGTSHNLDLIFTDKRDVPTESQDVNINRIEEDLHIKISDITTNQKTPQKYSIYAPKELYSEFFKPHTVTGGKRKSRRGKKHNTRRKKTHRRR